MLYFLDTMEQALFSGVSEIPRTPLYFLIIATVANIVLVILFVAVFRWGVAGAAYATLLANGLAFGLAIVWLNKTHKLIRIALGGLHFDRETFSQSLRIGLPTGIQQTLIALGALALLGIVNKFGTDVIAGFSVAGRLDMLATIPAMSFSQALSTFVGQNIGANKPERIRAGLISTVKMSGIVTIVTTLIIIFGGHLLMRMFTNDAEVIRLGDQYLTIVSFLLYFVYLYVHLYRTHAWCRRYPCTYVYFPALPLDYQNTHGLVSFGKSRSCWNMVGNTFRMADRAYSIIHLLQIRTLEEKGRC